MPGSCSPPPSPQEFGTSLPGSSGYKSGTKLLMESRAAGIPVEFLATVLENGDEDGDGFISREEFVDYMLESEKLLKQVREGLPARLPLPADHQASAPYLKWGCFAPVTGLLGL